MRKNTVILRFILLLTVWMTLANVLQMTKNFSSFSSQVNKVFISHCPHSKSLSQTVTKHCQENSGSFLGIIVGEHDSIPFVAVSMLFLMAAILRFLLYLHVIDKPPRLAISFQ